MKEKEHGGEKKRIEISMIEFDWVFKGDEGALFVEQLANSSNDDIFKVETIRICILFLWQYYFYRILICVFIPYLTFFVAYFIYSTFVTDGQMTMLDYFLGYFCFVYSIYAICLEIRQMYVQGREYFLTASAIWNVIDIGSTCCVLTVTINDLMGNPNQVT